MSGRALRIGALATVGLAVVFSVVLASRFGRDPGLVESPLLGEPAPTFELELLDGSGTFDTADLEGSIVVINFFASWCLECRKEHDDLVATSDAFADDNVRFVQIAYQEDSATTLDYLADVGRSDATVYLQDARSRAAIAFGVFGIPETFFIDETGTVVGKIIGEANALILGATLDSIIAGEVPGQQTTGETRQRP